MSRPTLPCIACGRELFQVDDMAAENQPYLATEFRTHGHYGSTAYDMEMGHYLIVNICDVCLSFHPERVHEGRDKKPVIEDGTIVGWKDADWKPVPWKVRRNAIAHTIEEALEEFGILDVAEPDGGDIDVEIKGAVDIDEDFGREIDAQTRDLNESFHSQEPSGAE